MCQIKKPLKKDCGTANPGGVARIVAIPKEYVESLGDNTNGVVSTITLVSGEKMTEMPFNKKTAKTVQGFKGDDPNFMNCTHGIDLDIPYITGVNNDAISSMIGVELLVFTKLNTGKWFILGDKSNGIYLTGGEGTSDAQGGKNTQGLKLLGEVFTHLPYEIEGTFAGTFLPDNLP